MTPREKAKELVNRMHLINSIKIAKQCALIAVDEIRDNLPLISEIQAYWIEVKNEINLL